MSVLSVYCIFGVAHVSMLCQSGWEDLNLRTTDYQLICLPKSMQNLTALQSLDIHCDEELEKSCEPIMERIGPLSLISQRRQWVNCIIYDRGQGQLMFWLLPYDKKIQYCVKLSSLHEVPERSSFIHSLVSLPRGWCRVYIVYLDMNALDKF